MILREIAGPISLGFTAAEVAATLGVRSSAVRKWLSELRNEIAADAET